MPAYTCFFVCVWGGAVELPQVTYMQLLLIGDLTSDIDTQLDKEFWNI